MASRKTALALPTPGERLVKDWWQHEALPVLDALKDLEAVLELTLQMAALAKYVKDRGQRFELDAGRLIGEIRIGELLGDGKTTKGKRRLPAPVREVKEDDRTRFRLLAQHRPLVLRLIREQRIASRKRILARLRRPPSNGRPEGIEIRHGDFREVLEDLTGKVDAIITDPPYGQEYLPLYGDLSAVATRLLRPGGICAVMTGHSYLPEIFPALGEHLSYRWMLAYLMGGATAEIYARRVFTMWKPILVYEKPPSDASHRIEGDVVRSPGGDTDQTFHSWGQNEAGMLSLIERLTEKSDLILDPFLGGGTTLVAAARAGRSAIGCDVDASAVAQAKERLMIADAAQ